MSDKHPVVLLIEKLYKSRELIADLYEAEDIQYFDPSDKKTQNLLNSLVNAQFVVPSGTDNYSLDTDLHTIFDKGLRQDTISYLHSDIGGEISKIRHSFKVYVNLPTTKEELRRKNKRELSKLFLGLSHRFNSTAEELFRRTQINFGRTDYSQSRVLENKYYLEELENLKTSYEEVVKLLSADEFSQEPLIDDLVTAFKGRTLQFFDKVGQTLELFKQFSYKERVQERKTKLLRKLKRYLDDNPTIRFDDTITAGGKLSRYTIPKRIKVYNVPDLNNEMFEEKYLTTLIKLKKSIKPSEKFNRSRSLHDQSSIPKKEQAVELSELMLKQLIIEVLQSNQPIKASEALVRFDSKKQLNPQFWNYVVLSAFFTKRKINGLNITRYLKHKPIYDDFSVVSGNRHVKDAVIEPLKPIIKE